MRGKVAGKEARPGAVRKTGTKKGATVGSGGNRKRALEGKKATPKAQDRHYHKAYKEANRKMAIKRAAIAKKNAIGPEYVLGRNPVVECLRSRIPALALYIVEGAQYDERLNEAVRLAADRGLALLEIPKHDLDKMVDNTLHQGLALQVPPYEYVQPEDLIRLSDQGRARGENPIIIALDNISDPRNLGAIIRSATAFGAVGVVIPARRSVGVTAVAWRTSAGTAAVTPVAKATNLTRTLKYYAAQGFQIMGLDIINAHSLDDYTADSPLVMVVGSEGKGLSRLVRETCDTIITVPMCPGAESLNASVAASIVLAECTRQRRLGYKK